MNPTRVACGLLGVGLTALVASGPLYAQEARPRAQTPEPARKIGPAADVQQLAFSVVIVLGDMQTASNGDTVPAAARKALTDMRDFLPYKGYRLLDAQFILGAQRAITRLRGPEEQEYQLTLRAVPEPNSLRVFFQLQEPGAESVPGQLGQVQAQQQEIAALKARLQEMENIAAREARERAQARGGAEPRSNATAQEAEKLRRQVSMLEGSMPSLRGRAVIDTSFSMDVGETVVVGTSRVRGGDKALIALLTAVPRGNAAKKQ